ncbi:NUDIX hydrolase [Halorarius halobius]|uniref:NUDIX hydrolase n=1 Tax=Halorarius halobius TaxID=2962671 RepID=UPI0020CE44A4|nr:NUDIX domain-containing protein [Halorarius halobius]
MSAGPSRARVTARLAQLQDAYDGFDVRQTTVSVDPAEFERAAEDRDVVAQVAVRVRDDDGRALVVPDGEGWADPGGSVGTSQPLVDTAVSLVEEETGVVPLVDSLERVSIVCVNCETDDQLYQLHALFEARPEAGSVRPPAQWREDPPADPF